MSNSGERLSHLYIPERRRDAPFQIPPDADILFQYDVRPLAFMSPLLQMPEVAILSGVTADSEEHAYALHLQAHSELVDALTRKRPQGLMGKAVDALSPMFMSRLGISLFMTNMSAALRDGLSITYGYYKQMAQLGLLEREAAQRSIGEFGEIVKNPVDLDETELNLKLVANGAYRMQVRHGIVFWLDELATYDSISAFVRERDQSGNQLLQEEIDRLYAFARLVDDRQKKADVWMSGLGNTTNKYSEVYITSLATQCQIFSQVK